MKNLAAFVAGIFVATVLGVVAQIGGKVSELNAVSMYAQNLYADTAEISLPQYSDDTEACAGGLVAGQLYHDDDAAAAAQIVAVQSC